MKPKRQAFLAKLLNRLDRVGPHDLQNYLQQLVKEQGFLETIFNTLQEGILVIDSEGKILYLNHSIAHLLGFGEEAIGRHVANYLKDLDWDAILRDGQVLNRHLEVSYPEWRLLNFYLVPLADERLGSAIIFHDITETQKKTQRVIESEKLNALTLLAAGVAHELGNPLNSLHIHFQLLERDLKQIKPKPSEKILESVQIAQAEIARLDTIINQFLRAVRPGAQERKLAQLNEVVLESLAVLKPELADRDILVESHLEKALPAVEINITQIKQALFNLIKNSIHAMTHGGLLQIHTTRNDTHVLLAIHDNGKGIDAEIVTRIGHPYFTTKKEGSGLGLFIVRRIVEEHGGELALESEKGKGTTARIFLPLKERRFRLLTDRSSE